MDIRLLPIAHPDIARLVEEVQQEYVARYGGRDETPYESHEFDAPHGAFFVGYVDDRPVATGAWRRSSVVALGSDSTVEVKRMYVTASARGRGHARAMLAHLEASAAAAGYDVVVLESGTAQPEALTLYESAGYQPIPSFGHYRDSELNRCYARALPVAEHHTWDAEADGFDAEPDHGLLDPDTRQAWRRLLLEVLPPAPAQVLDLGCGTGTLSVLLAAEGYDVTGLDVSEAMLERARLKADRAGVAVEFLPGDANRPPFSRARFDAVLDRHVLWAMHDPDDVILRWARLVAPGGTLLLVEGSWHTGAGLEPEEAERLVRLADLEPHRRMLDDPQLWGGPIDDRRYLVTARV